MRTGADALRAAIPRLRAAGVEDAARDARVLLAHALGLPADRLTLHLADDLSAPQVQAFEAAVVAREARRPVSQITGTRQFWGRSFHVSQHTLDPRPETETLVAEAVLHPIHRMLDLGTGTGCILLSCLADQPMARGFGADISALALDMARHNAAALGLDQRATFVQSDWCAAIEGRFDLIVSNPPYIAAADLAALAPEVRDWEPHLALTPGQDGLEAYRILARQIPSRLIPGGRVLLETGLTQGAAVARLLQDQGFAAIRILPDMDGRDRVVAALSPADEGRCGSA